MNSTNRLRLLLAGVGVFALGAGAYLVFFKPGGPAPPATDLPVAVRNPHPAEVTKEPPRRKPPRSRPDIVENDGRETRPVNRDPEHERRKKLRGRPEKTGKRSVSPAS